MRVVLLAAGASSMICGSCLRDNRLAATLREQGRDVSLIPLYTPLRTDEPTIADKRVLLGGIGAYLSFASSLWRALPRALTRWADHPAVLRAVGGMAASTDASRLGGLTLSVLRGEHGEQHAAVRELLAELRARRPEVVHLPDLLFLGIATALRRELPETAIVCTLSGEDLFIDGLPAADRAAVVREIRDRAADVDAYTATSRYYAGHCTSAYGIPAERLHVTPLGIRVQDAPTERPPPFATPTVGYFARVCRAKGLHRLAGALVELRRRGVVCRVVAGGYLQEPAYLREVERFLADRGALDRFEYRGELSRADKFAALASFDVLCVPTEYAEAKGLYVIEALACGTPVVLPRHGSFPELVEATGGGVQYAPDDETELADALQRVLADTELRRSLGERGRRAVHELFTDRVMAEATWSVYEHARRAGSLAP